MLSGSCHCGAVTVTVPRKPRRLTSCNCSICRRYGALWAYYKPREVRVACAKGKTASYAWGDGSLRFLRCKDCGCVTHWEPVQRDSDGRMGVNARMFDPGIVETVPVRHFDGATTWRFLD